MRKNGRHNRGHEVSMNRATEMVLNSVAFGTDTGNWRSEPVKLKKNGPIPTAGISPGGSPPPKPRPDINSA